MAQQERHIEKTREKKRHFPRRRLDIPDGKKKKEGKGHDQQGQGRQKRGTFRKEQGQRQGGAGEGCDIPRNFPLGERHTVKFGEPEEREKQHEAVKQPESTLENEQDKDGQRYRRRKQSFDGRPPLSFCLLPFAYCQLFLQRSRRSG